ncbi:restriction endonuclease subunit S [Nitrosococcus watsonii]|uniref:Restriction modification system DNA specificity domain protein n=1 Tax=Nitrosococcus watsoni (strain C-113) TaxID=105559 RepID=D8K5Q3_NITWC|nr:restriction endonuclease subunit S [Nitrosococcus watsonii]ADJ28230.1 restriction modification system DNA specificity domain protein [Nitrosococcus watsonii C-113]
MISDFRTTVYGQVSSKLQEKKLSELCVGKSGIQTGPFGSQLHKYDYVEQGTPIITVEHLGDNRIEHLNTPYVSDADRHRLSKYQIKEGDIVFSRVGSVDRRALVRKQEDGWLFSGRCLRVRVENELIDPAYLSYFFGLETFKSYIRSIAVGATMPSINTKILSDLPIYYCSDLEEQKEIAKLLLTLDDKIQLNHQINQTLEQMAQAIFKSWFVDFEPVKAKIAALKAGGSEEDALLAAMQAISGKSSEQLTRLQAEQPEQYAELRATAEPFPSAMQESELGEIPEGWGVGALQDLCLKVESGGTPKRNIPEYWGGEIKWLASGEVRDVIAFGTKEKITKSGLENSSAKLWPKYSTVVAMYGATAGQVCLLADTMTTNQACCGLIPKENNKAFLFITARNSVSSLADKASGSAQQNLNKGLVSRHASLLPPENVLLAYESITFPLIHAWIQNTHECVQLTELRDSLLPKLLSGELSISDAECRVSEMDVSACTEDSLL